MQKNLVSNLKIENFAVSIDRVVIEYQSSQADSNQKFLLQFRSIEQQVRLIENLEKSVFEKQSILMQKLFKAHCF